MDVGETKPQWYYAEFEMGDAIIRGDEGEEHDHLTPAYLNALEAKAALATEMAEALEKLAADYTWSSRAPNAGYAQSHPITGAKAILARYHALQQEGTKA